MYQKWPKEICPLGYFIFSHCKDFGAWGGGSREGGGVGGAIKVPKKYHNSGLECPQSMVLNSSPAGQHATSSMQQGNEHQAQHMQARGTVFCTSVLRTADKRLCTNHSHLFTAAAVPEGIDTGPLRSKFRVIGTRSPSSVSPQKRWGVSGQEGPRSPLSAPSERTAHAGPAWPRGGGSAVEGYGAAPGGPAPPPGPSATQRDGRSAAPTSAAAHGAAGTLCGGTRRR